MEMGGRRLAGDWLGGWVWMEMVGNKLTGGGLKGWVWMVEFNKDGREVSDSVVYFVDIPLGGRFWSSGPSVGCILVTFSLSDSIFL